jgi:hypothetical protein
MQSHPTWKKVIDNRRRILATAKMQNYTNTNKIRLCCVTNNQKHFLIVHVHSYSDLMSVTSSSTYRRLYVYKTLNFQSCLNLVHMSAKGVGWCLLLEAWIPGRRVAVKNGLVEWAASIGFASFSYGKIVLGTFGAFKRWRGAAKGSIFQRNWASGIGEQNGLPFSTISFLWPNFFRYFWDEWKGTIKASFSSFHPTVLTEPLSVKMEISLSLSKCPATALGFLDNGARQRSSFLGKLLWFFCSFSHCVHELVCNVSCHVN